MIEQIAKQYQRPTFIYQRKTIEQSIHRIQNCLIPQAELLYSMKANPNQHVIQTMVSQQLGFECSSAYELHCAEKSGCPIKKIVCIGPGKSAALIRRCIQLDVAAIYCESIAELNVIQEMAAALEKTAHVVLRVHAEKSHHKPQISMTGKHNQFGMDHKAIDYINQHHDHWDQCQIIGLHYYQGSKQNDPYGIRQLIMDASKDFQKHQRHWHRPLGIMGIGLGIGQLDPNQYHHVMDQKLWSEPLNIFKQQQPNTRILIELGRSLVAQSGRLLCQVQYTKTLNGNLWAILDTGYHHIMDACFNTTYLRQYPTIRPLLKRPGLAKSYRLSGPLCTPADRLHYAFESTALKRGDFLIIYDVGAYAWNHSPILFLGHEPADQFFIDHEQVLRSNELHNFLNYHKDPHEHAYQH